MNNTTVSGNEPSGMRHKVHRTLTAAHRFVARLLPGPRAWCGATWGVVLAAALLWTAMSAHAFAPTGPLAFIVGLLGGLVAGALVGGIAMLVGAMLSAVPRRYGWAFIGALPPLLMTYMLAVTLAFGVVTVVLGILVISSLVGAGLAALTGRGWRQLSRLRRGLALAGLSVGLIGLIGGATALFMDGFPQTPPINAAAQSAANVVPLALPDLSQPGPYTVRTLIYGSGEDRRRPEYGPAALEPLRLATASNPGTDRQGAFHARRRRLGGGLPDLRVPVRGFLGGRPRFRSSEVG